MKTQAINLNLVERIIAIEPSQFIFSDYSTVQYREEVKRFRFLGITWRKPVRAGYYEYRYWSFEREKNYTFISETIEEAAKACDLIVIDGKLHSLPYCH